MHPVAIMTCLENSTILDGGSDYQKKAYIVKMAVLFKKPELGGKVPPVRAQLTLESDNPLPYVPGKKYNIRLSEDAGLVVAGSIPPGAEVPGGKG